MPNAVFFNGQPMNDDARQALAEGYDPSTNVPVGVWRQQQQQATPVMAPQPQQASPMTTAVQQAFQPQQQTPVSDTAGPQQAVEDQKAAIPTAPPPAITSGPIQQSLGLPPTVELANKYRFNPPWRI